MKKSCTFAEETRIYNLAEISTRMLQKPHNVIAPKRLENVDRITSRLRGTLVTTCCFISASAVALPPVMVSPTKNFKDLIIKNILVHLSLQL